MAALARVGLRNLAGRKARESTVVGKKSRAKRERRAGTTTTARPPTPHGYLSRLSAFPPYENADHFWEDLSERHGSAARALRSTLRSDPDARWDRKNESRQFSLDVSLGFSGALYRAQLTWLRGFLAQRSPDTVLDLGCENGLVTCYAALAAPQAEVVGVDLSQAAIERAEELRDHLRIRNVRFCVGDFATVDLPGADCVLWSRALAHPIEHDAGTAFLLEEVAPVSAEEPVAEAVAPLGRLVKPAGEIALMERLPHAEAALVLAQALAFTGLTVNWPDSTFLQAHELGAPQRLPVLAVRRGSARPNPVEVLKLFASGEDRLERGVVREESAAELLYVTSAREASLILGAQIIYFEGSIERAEVLEGQRESFLWRTTSRGARSLKTVPPSEIDVLIAELRHLENELSDVADVCFYEHPDGRPIASGYEP